MVKTASVPNVVTVWSTQPSAPKAASAAQNAATAIFKFNFILSS
jgi:hypothetical protein